MKAIRKDFPILKMQVADHELVYLDNAATSQKPHAVIDAITQFYTQYNNNIHRSVHAFGEQTTALYEKARAAVATFINADPTEIIFTKGTTEGINFIAQAWAAKNLREGDEIVLTELEHHANIFPWLEVARAKKIAIRYIPVTQHGELEYVSLPSIITNKTKLVSVAQTCNSLGTHNDVAPIISAARAVGARVFIDAAQSAAHQPIDVQKMDCHFLAFSGHKMLGPTGIGVLYIKKELHDQVAPYQFGGGMIYEADYYHATWQKAPHKYEAGTPPIAQAIGLAAALEYKQKHIPWHAQQAHEAALCKQLIDDLSAHPEIQILGPIDQLKRQGHMVSFVIDGIHAHDAAAFLGSYGICVRAGNHCAQPLAQKLGIAAWLRASFYAYNTNEEVEKLLKYINLLLCQFSMNKKI
jgi:cysteine desulfurase/selenocysteine lyase